MDERITKYFLGQLSKEERVHLLKERETDKEIKEDFAAAQNIHSLMRLTPASIGYTEGEENFARVEKKVKRRKMWSIGRRVAGYAAAVAITFIAVWVFTYDKGFSSGISMAQQELYVPAGQRARITLPDGSTVWLNAGSTLFYPSVFDKERKVKLEGEGFFDVAKDAHKPFIVTAGDVEVKALGTQFNVYNYKKSGLLRTTLAEGSVLVYYTGKEKSGHLLEPNQQLIIDNGEFILEKSIDKDELLWKDGIYSFKKERMHDIINKLELYFDVEIEVKNPRIPDYEYTGKFRQRDGILDILRIIQKIHHFKIENNEDLSKITLS